MIVIMSYLIIDTETNGVNPITDKIIEVGGLIAEYDNQKHQLVYVDSYQSLIYLETGLDSRITDLTGITVDELNEAPKRPRVQAEWEAFLEKYNITHILGHSLDFDTGFMKSNGFFLPEAYKLDTLDITKIACPDTKAVNLDYLNKANKLDQYFPKPPELMSLQHHRALYDAFMCASLYNFVILQLSKSNTTVDFLFAIDDFMKERLMISANTSNNNKVMLMLDSNVNCLKKPLNETVQYKFSKIVEDETAFNTVNNIYLAQRKDGPIMYKKVLLSIWFAMLNVEKLGKVFINGGQEKKFYELILNSISPNKEEMSSQYNLKFPEEFILDSKELTTRQSSFKDINDFIELYSDLRTKIDHEFGLFKLSFNKILIDLKSVSKSSFFNLDKLNAPLDQNSLINHLEEYKNFLNILEKTIVTKFSNTALEVELIRKIKDSIYILEKNNISFFTTETDIRMILNQDFDLKSYLEDLILNAKSVETSLTPKEYLEFTELFNLDGNANVIYGKDIEEKMSGSILDHLKESKAKIKIVLIGKSSNLKSFPQKLSNAEIPYIDISNSGSATKILSAIEHGYEGIAVLNYKNIEFIGNFITNHSEDIEFYYYGDTFLALSKSIKDLNTKNKNPFEFDKSVSKLYLKFLLNKLNHKFNKKIMFFPEQ